MAWDEWEQLKKQAVERAERGPYGGTAADADTRGERLEPGTAGPADHIGPAESAATTEHGVARRVERIRHVIDTFRDTTVLVPLVPFEGGQGFVAADFGGVRWIHAFTDELAAGRFNELQDAPGGTCDFMSVHGWRLLDVVIPAMGVPCGVALDVGSEDDGVLLPPVAGIVPDAAAVDAGVNGSGERSW